MRHQRAEHALSGARGYVSVSNRYFSTGRLVLSVNNTLRESNECGRGLLRLVFWHLDSFKSPELQFQL